MIITCSKILHTEIYRKAIHLSSLWMPLFLLLADRNISIIVFLALLFCNLATEYSAYKYRRSSFIGRSFRKMFFKTLRPREVIENKFTPSGAVYVLLAALSCAVCFSKEAGAMALTVMLIADTMAALVGRFCGIFRFHNGKSLEGTSAFFISAMLILLSFAHQCPLPVIFSTAIVATFVEFFEDKLKLDDNLSIPLAVGFMLNFFYM